MRDNSKSIINFMYFGNNYDHDFIEKCWKNDKCIADHLKDKFLQMYVTHATMTFFKWFMELDDYNKEVLTNYVEYNYLAWEHLRTNLKQPKLK